MAVSAVHVPARWPSLLGGAAVLGAATVLAIQLRDVPFGRLITGMDLGWLALALVAVTLSFVAAAHNLTAFAPIRVRAWSSLRAQLAVSGLRVVAPSAVSTPAIGTRYLSRSGLATSEAVAVVATAQVAQLAMTCAVVGVLALSGTSAASLPDGQTIAWVCLAVATGLALTVVVARRIEAVRRGLAGLRRGFASIAAHARTRPMRVVTGLLASAGLTLAHVATFACCVHAMGGTASILALTLIYLAAAGAGSLIPTPGGIGPVEAAMISGLAAAGVPAATATLAALLTRLVTVWLPALPGWWALRSLRREGAL